MIEDVNVALSNVLAPSWWLRDRDGRRILFQFPNPSLWVWIATALASAFKLWPSHAQTLSDVGHGALIAWALDELVRGATPFRRALGLVVLVTQIAAIV